MSCLGGWGGTPPDTQPAVLLAVGFFLLPQPTPLHETPGHRLDAFIKFFLQPNQTFLDQMSSAVDVICSFLKEECFRHSATKVQKSVKVSLAFLTRGVAGRMRSSFWSSEMLVPQQRLKGRGGGKEAGAVGNEDTDFRGGGGADGRRRSSITHV